jgi:Asp-tRNA(Asn)/Glu-tRNA(Gln) amidotransferase A subunit family amidase
VDPPLRLRRPCSQFTFGLDTNGSTRVPSSLYGIFGLKPTFGRLPRTGTFPFVSSLDHLGPFARSVADLVLVSDACQGQDEVQLDKYKQHRKGPKEVASARSSPKGNHVSTAKILPTTKIVSYKRG